MTEVDNEQTRQV